MSVLPKIDISLQNEIDGFAHTLLRRGETPDDAHRFLRKDFGHQFDDLSEKLKYLNVTPIYSHLYHRDIEVVIRYVWESIANLHLRSLIDQNFFFNEIDQKSSDLAKFVIRSGDKWGLLETKHLTKKFPMPWHSIGNIEVHIHQTIPGSLNSSQWLSELFSVVSEANIFVRPDIFRLNSVGTSGARMERAAIYGRPFDKEWLKSLKNVEIAEHAPNPENHLEQGHRTQFIWEPLLSQGKIQFAIEELPEGNTDHRCTRFIHGIYNLTSEKFEHFDGAVHIYSKEEYENRKLQHLKNHNNNYSKAKIFLVDSEITIERGIKLIGAFYRWNTMPVEYFTRR